MGQSKGREPLNQVSLLRTWSIIFVLSWALLCRPISHILDRALSRESMVILRWPACVDLACPMNVILVWWLWSFEFSILKRQEGLCFMGMSLGLGRPSKVMGLYCVCFCYSSFSPLSVWYSAPLNKRESWIGASSPFLWETRLVWFFLMRDSEHVYLKGKASVIYRNILI